MGITIKKIDGVHCESCGRVDPDAPDGYTSCCNELVCDGGWISTFAVERADGSFVAARAHCWAQLPGVGGHRDCSGCTVHKH